MEHVYRQMEDEIKLRGYSKKTMRCYTNCLRQLGEYYNRPFLSLTPDEFRAFFLHLLNDRKLSGTSLHHYYYAILFYLRIFGKEELLKSVPRFKQVVSFPVVLSRKEIGRIFNCINNLKYRSLYAIMYGGGLRGSELCNLTISDVDFDRKMIRIVNGKGKRGRYTIMPRRAATLLREYIDHYEPVEWLFFRQTNKNLRLNIRQVQAYFSDIVKATKLNKKASLHTLRHSFATHLLEQGTSIFYIQKLMGHSNIHTTLQYLHIQNVDIGRLKSPFDSQEYFLEDLDRIEAVQMHFPFFQPQNNADR